MTPGAGYPVFLDGEADGAIRQRIARLEAATGVETVAAVVSRADSYPEIPWKAFALGASAAATATFAAALVEPGWGGVAAVIETVVAVLAAGASAALATVWIAPFARLFLPRARAQAEALQAAQAMFLEAELHRTRRRDAVLILVCLFEREVVVLPDTGLREKLGAAELEAVIAAVTTRLKRGELRDALLDGLSRIHETLAAHGFRAQPSELNELPDAVVQQRGPS